MKPPTFNVQIVLYNDSMLLLQVCFVHIKLPVLISVGYNIIVPCKYCCPTAHFSTVNKYPLCIGITKVPVAVIGIPTFYIAIFLCSLSLLYSTHILPVKLLHMTQKKKTQTADIAASETMHRQDRVLMRIIRS